MGRTHGGIPLANYLKMLKRQQVLTLLAMKWSFRKIERETGVRRETISGYAREAESDPANPAKTFPGSGGGESPDSQGLKGGRFKPGQNVRRVGFKSGQYVPRLGQPAVWCSRAPRRDHGEAGRGPDHPEDLPGPRRGLQLRLQLRVGEAVREEACADAKDEPKGAEEFCDKFAG